MANNYVYFVSADFIRSHSNISSNVQDAYIYPSMRESQETEIREVIGGAMMDKLTSLIRSNDIVKDEYADYRDLLDALKYFYTYATVAKLVMVSSVKIGNGGSQITNDENLQQLTLKDTFALENYYIQKKDAEKYRFQEYLKANKDKYEELKGCSCGYNAPNLDSATSNIYLGGTRTKKTIVKKY